MSIDIRNFVNVNIDRNVKLTISGSRPEVMLFSAKSKLTLVGSNSDYTKFYKEDYSEATVNTSDLPYVKYFFMNGGCKLTLTTEALPTTQSGLEAISNDVVVLASTATITSTTLALFDKLEGIHQKIFVMRQEATTTAPTSSNFIACKLSSNAGSEMTIAAYLSQIKFYENASPVDYCFTKESLVTNEDKSSDITADSDTLIKTPYNFNIKIGDNYYNVGGNTTNGEDLVEQYGLIVMQQDLTTSVFKTLSTKISGQKGLAAIRTSISEVMDMFVESGFLTTEKVWTSSDLVLPNKADGSKPNETIITKNTPISNGYYIHMFKISGDLRKAYAVIVVATNKGIRYVIVDGKAI